MNLSVCEHCLRHKIEGYSILVLDCFHDSIRIFIRKDFEGIIGCCYLHVNDHREKRVSGYNETFNEIKFIELVDKKCPYYTEHFLYDWSKQ